MLNLRETTFKLYEPVFADLAPVTRRKIRAAFDSRQSFLERMSLLVYAANSVKAKRVGTSMDAVMFHMEKQAKELDGVNPTKLVEALTVIEKFNWMNTEYIRYKRANPDADLPYVTFEPCFWYVDALRLLNEINKEEYPLINGWSEFFMFLPLSGEMKCEGRGGKVLRLMEYVFAVKDGVFHRWYQREKGYGSKMSQFARGGFEGMYEEELSGMDAAELQDEFMKFSWGHAAVKRELGRRGKHG